MKRLGLITVLILFAASSLFAFDGYVEVTNETGYTIYKIFVSHEDNEFWDDDMLGDEVLMDGDSYRIYLTGHPSSIFDIMAEDEDGDTYTFYDFDVEQNDIVITLENLDGGEGAYAGETTVNGPGGDFDGYVDISNDTGFTMYYLQIRQNSKSWGPDLLGDDILPYGEIYTVNLNNFPSSVFDIRLEDEEGDTYTYYDVDVENDDVLVTLDHLDLN